MSKQRAGQQSEGGVSARQIFGWLALALLLLWIVLNTQSVKVDLIVSTVTMPLFVALVIAGLLGALITWLLPRIRGDGN